MKRKLFLDDARVPHECRSYMLPRLSGNQSWVYVEGYWSVVKSYDEFVENITTNGVPNLVSFDHDLTHEHLLAADYFEDHPDIYEKCKDPTGYDCLKWLIAYCTQNGEIFPECLIHNMGELGTKRLQSLLDKYNQNKVIYDTV